MRLAILGDPRGPNLDAGLGLRRNLRRDGGTQPRAEIIPSLVADGFHRTAGKEKIGNKKIPAQVHQGTRRDAILYAAGANAAHGQRRTNADKRRAVETLLRDKEWGNWSDREIARRCNVSDRFVNEVRATANIRSDKRNYNDKHGVTRTMNTANIGRKPAAAIVTKEESPRKKLRGIDHARCGRYNNLMARKKGSSSLWRMISS